MAVEHPVKRLGREPVERQVPIGERLRPKRDIGILDRFHCTTEDIAGEEHRPSVNRAVEADRSISVAGGVEHLKLAIASQQGLPILDLDAPRMVDRKKRLAIQVAAVAESRIWTIARPITGMDHEPEFGIVFEQGRKSLHVVVITMGGDDRLDGTDVNAETSEVREELRRGAGTAAIDEHRVSTEDEIAIRAMAMWEFRINDEHIVRKWHRGAKRRHGDSCRECRQYWPARVMQVGYDSILVGGSSRVKISGSFLFNNSYETCIFGIGMICYIKHGTLQG